MDKRRKLDWSKAYSFKPKDHLTSNVFAKTKKFVPSYEKDASPPLMSSILSWEYSRIWLTERDDYIANRGKQAQPKRISNDFSWWLVKRAPKQTGKRY